MKFKFVGLCLFQLLLFSYINYFIVISFFYASYSIIRTREATNKKSRIVTSLLTSLVPFLLFLLHSKDNRLYYWYGWVIFFYTFYDISLISRKFPKCFTTAGCLIKKRKITFFLCKNEITINT